MECVKCCFIDILHPQKWDFFLCTFTRGGHSNCWIIMSGEFGCRSGISQRGTPNWDRMRQPILEKLLAKNCTKIKEIGLKGALVPSVPLIQTMNLARNFSVSQYSNFLIVNKTLITIARKWSCGEVMFSQASIHQSFWPWVGSRLWPLLMMHWDMRPTSPFSPDMGPIPLPSSPPTSPPPPEYQSWNLNPPLLLTSSSDYWRPAQTCSLELPLPTADI